MSNDNNRSNEQRAKDQAYQEYLKLRENSSSRGHYVKDDTLYGEYFPAGHEGGKRSGWEKASSSDGTAYGNSRMRRSTKQQEQS